MSCPISKCIYLVQQKTKENVEEHRVEFESNSDTFESLPKRAKWEGYYVKVKGMLCRESLHTYLHYNRYRNKLVKQLNFFLKL